MLCALGQIRACCCQGKFQSSPCARWVPFSAQRKRPESPYLVECAVLVSSRHRCRGEGGVLKKRSDWVGSVLRISLLVPSLSARRVPLPRGIPWVARIASPVSLLRPNVTSVSPPGSRGPGSQLDQSWGAPVLGAASRVSGVAILTLFFLVRAGQLSLFGAPSQG